MLSTCSSSKKYTIHEVYHIPSPFDITSTVLIKTRKTELDTQNGYHSLVLYEMLKETRTLITKWGLYRYYRALVGFNVSSDAYARRLGDIIAGQLRVVICVDDFLL